MSINKKIISLVGTLFISSTLSATPFELNSNGLSHVYFPLNDSQSNWYIASGSNWHNGSDYWADDWNLRTGGNTDIGEEIIASFSGEVILADKDNTVGDYGKEVIIRSTDNPSFAMRYAHLDSVDVNKGDIITAKSKIGTVGNTGTIYAHLHLVLYKNLDDHALGRLKKGYSAGGITGNGYHYGNPDKYAAKFNVDATSGGISQNNNTTSGILDGAGSLVNPKGNGYGHNYDIAKMHPHPGTGSTVVFQWLYDEETCSQLDISSQYDIGDVIIKSKKWSEHLTQKAFKIKLNEDAPITMKRPETDPTWITFAVTTTKSLTFSNSIKAECKTPNDRFKTGIRSDVNKDLVDVTFNYFWTGSGSIISNVNRTFNPPYGMTADEAVTFRTKNSLTSFQWLKQGTCNKLKISASNNSSSSVAGVHIKEWDAETWGNSKCNSLPCTLNPSSNDFYVIKVKSSPNAISSGSLYAECVQ